MESCGSAETMKTGANTTFNVYTALKFEAKKHIYSCGAAEANFSIAFLPLLPRPRPIRILAWHFSLLLPLHRVQTCILVLPGQNSTGTTLSYPQLGVDQTLLTIWHYIPFFLSLQDTANFAKVLPKF